MSKVRLVVCLEGRTYYGGYVYRHIKQFAEAYRVPRLPEELRTAPKWKKIIWKFEQLPIRDKQLFIYREPNRVQPNASQYVIKLGHYGVGKQLKRNNWQRPPAPRQRRPAPAIPDRPDRNIRFVREVPAQAGDIFVP